MNALIVMELAFQNCNGWGVGCVIYRALVVGCVYNIQGTGGGVCVCVCVGGGRGLNMVSQGEIMAAVNTHVRDKSLFYRKIDGEDLSAPCLLCRQPTL